ncbi:MAG: hypothetical protein JWP84_2599 [Tardiphaga sp.]|nr:hypothetical protein [Tardiphaga sp.]
MAMTRIAIVLACLITASNAVAQPLTPRPETPAWFASAVAAAPPGRVPGQVFHIDTTDPQSPIAYVAVYPAGADDPKSASSAFDTGEMLVVELTPVDGRLTVRSADIRPRDVTLSSDVSRVISSARDEREYLALHADLLAKRSALPDGTMPCDLRAWSSDTDPNGLNVRAQPSATSKVLGTLPPPYKFKSKSENAPDGGWLTEFSIVGFKDGWFLIEGAKPPGRDYEGDDYPRRHPKPYAGRGWVAASKVGAAYANGDTRMGGLFQAPHVDAKWTPATGDGGGEISADGGPKRILACSGFWALVESHDGIRGWWRRLCSSQVTNCS